MYSLGVGQIPLLSPRTLKKKKKFTQFKIGRQPNTADMQSKHSSPLRYRNLTVLETFKQERHSQGESFKGRSRKEYLILKWPCYIVLFPNNAYVINKMWLGAAILDNV